MIAKGQPKYTKFKRLHKGTIRKCQYRLSAKYLQQGSAGLRVLKSGRFTQKQLEQARRKIVTVRKRKEKQKIWFRCIPDIPITAKSLGLRMGKGKGAIKYWSARLRAGKVIFQINRMTKRREVKALHLIKKVLPVPTKIILNKVTQYVKLKTY